LLALIDCLAHLVFFVRIAELHPEPGRGRFGRELLIEGLEQIDAKWRADRPF
jgi:hypothetical protein